MPKFLHVLTAAAMILTPAQPATATATVTATAGTTYYVDAAGGDDAASGLDEAHAWKSLGKLNETTFRPGDRILLRAGQRWTGQLWPKGSGESGAPITIDRYGESGKPRIGRHTYVAELANAAGVTRSDPLTVAAG
ncbi:hypothetical protein [Nonomuraea sp. B19D2]|uniref:hypothetical protein n=1 Tax=Nonomuraea sp. B19D2 TaxID=3159561 RepID=UPI0032DB3893